MSFVGELNERYFDGRLSPEVLALMASIDAERPEVQALVERMCRHLHRQRIEAHDLSEGLAFVTGYYLPRILPGAWGGVVPPITQQGRHASIDEYLARNPWRRLEDGDRLLDLGCGFPPVTTLDTADRLPGVHIVGADPSFGRFLVREASGDYAVFDERGDLLYFQAGAMDVRRWEALYADPAATRRRFSSYRDSLCELLPEDETGTGAVSREGVELVRNPVKTFERGNARFERLGVGSGGLSGFAAVRCFNVLYYFDAAFRREALAWLAGVLVEGGISITGGNWSRSRFARYTVHRVEHGSMVAREFAFSIENVRPLEVVALFALHEGDHDLTLLSSLIGALRSDDRFRHDVDRRIDEVQAEIGFCARKPNGYLGAITPDTDARVIATAAERVGLALERDGFPERAVEVLGKRGYRAWVNCVGHVAIDPADVPVQRGSFS
jgi:hypothetical protein